MEILFVSHKYPPSTGGMEKQSYELITGMPRHATVRKIVYLGNESYFQFFRRLNDRILDKVNRYPKIKVIHFNDGLIAAAALMHKGYNHLYKVVTLHGLDVVFPLGIYQKHILPRFNKYDHIIAVSKATATEIIQRGIQPEKISVIPNGIDHSISTEISDQDWQSFRNQYSIPDGKRILMTLGRPVKRKGFSWFIQKVLPLLPEDYYLIMAGPFDHQIRTVEKWLSRLPSSWQNIYMLFTGYPSDQETLRHILKNPMYAGRVNHVGKLPSEDLKILMKNSAFFLMPNIRVKGDMEGFGLVCLEASICGAFVIAAELEGITDAIKHAKNGILVRSEDHLDWSNTIKKIAENPEDFKNQRELFKNYTKNNFSWHKMVAAYAQLFKKLVDKKKETD